MVKFIAVHRTLPLAALALMAISNFSFGADDSELIRLRRENAELHRQLDAVNRQCAASAPKPAPLAAAPHAGTESPAGPAPVLPAAAAPDESAKAAPSAPSVPAGYKLVKIPPSDLEPYANIGCDRGRDSKDPRWKRKDNWEYLAAGMSQEEVRDLLGIEHHDIANGDRVGWEYGKCGLRAHGTVVFTNGVVSYWKAPTF